MHREKRNIHKILRTFAGVDDGNKPVLVNQHPLHSHSIQGGDTEKIQIIAHTMTNLEAQRRSTNKTRTTKQWLRLKAT